MRISPQESDRLIIFLLLLLFIVLSFNFSYLITYTTYTNDEFGPNQIRPDSGSRTPYLLKKDLNNSYVTKSVSEVDMGKAPVANILRNAGIVIDEELLQELPSWSDIVSMYGNEPKILGLDTCSSYRSLISVDDALIGPAGMFNTGTNLLSDLLRINCHIPNKTISKKNHYGCRTGMLYQVPWGKHNPVSWRTKNVALAHSDGITQTDVLPVVTIKDPYSWMISMCRHPYAVKWKKSRSVCPHLVPREGESIRKTSLGARVEYKQQNVTHYESLVHIWNEWYGDYKAFDFPRLIIRFEDLLFHLEKVMSQVCYCVGGKIKDKSGKILMETESAKGTKGAHNGANGLLSAILRYGNTTKRLEGMTKTDLEYTKNILRNDLMEDFQYTYIDP